MNECLTFHRTVGILYSATPTRLVHRGNATADSRERSALKFSRPFSGRELAHRQTVKAIKKGWEGRSLRESEDVSGGEGPVSVHQQMGADTVR